MPIFSSDVDIMRYEPVLFGDLYQAGSALCRGEDGQLTGTSFQAAGADFGAVGVSGRSVIYLRDDEAGIEGAYEVVSVDSANELTVSVLRSELDEEAISPGESDNLKYRISTFSPLANAVGIELTEYFGIAPGNPTSRYDAEDILDGSVLRQVSVYAVLSSIYASLGGDNKEGKGFWEKSLYYHRLFEKAKERCRLSLNAGGDNVTERTAIGGSIRLLRD